MTGLEPPRTTNWNRSIDCDDGRPCIEIAKVNEKIVLRDSSDGKAFRLAADPTIDFLVGVKRGDFDHLDSRLRATESSWRDSAPGTASAKEGMQNSSVIERNILLIALIVALAIGVALIAGVVSVWAGFALPVAVQKGGSALGGAILVITALVGVVYRNKGR